MKHIFKIVVMLGLLAASPPLIADPEPAPKISLIYVANSDWNIDWEGTPNRIYFVQASLDLENWMFAQSIKFGTGLKTMRVNSDNAPNFFVRLHYYDDPLVTTLEQAMNADFDKDGVSNIHELTILRTDPMVFSGNGSGIADGKQDWDDDGISNADEIALGLDPGVNNTVAAAGVVAVDFGYDDANRLIVTTSPVGTASYNPDAEGNIR